MNPPSERFLRNKMPIPMEEVYPSGEKKVIEWEKVEKGFGKMEKWFEKEDTFICGDTVTFADFSLGGYLMWIKIAFGLESEEWKDVSRWNNGRWGKFLKSLEKYEKF
jgi:glutathione S-transferase